MTATTYPTYRTALLSVDPHNDLMSEDARFYEATRETAESVGFFDQYAQGDSCDSGRQVRVAKSETNSRPAAGLDRP
jgi:hypothetical protein